MGAYGETTYGTPIERVGAGGKRVAFSAVFTTAGSSAPTIDATKTRGVVSIARSTTGIHLITLPYKLRNCIVRVSQRGTTAQLAQGDQTDNTATVTVTTVTAGGSTAADSTGIIITVDIEGTSP